MNAYCMSDANLFHSTFEMRSYILWEVLRLLFMLYKVYIGSRGRQNDNKAEIWLLKICQIWWNHLKSNKKYMILQIIIEFAYSFSTRDYLEAETLGREGGDCSSLASSCPLSLFSFKWELRCILYQGGYSEWFITAGKQALKKTDQNLWWRPLESSLP